MKQADLEKIANLAYINTHDIPALLDENNVILELINRLQQVDTSGIAPLIHPLDLYQPLRNDDVTEPNSVTELAKITPIFIDDLYVVPNVIRGK